MLEGHGLKITGIKQSQKMNVIVEVILRRGANTSINLMEDHISNFRGVQ